MWSIKYAWFLRLIRRTFAALLMGLGILLPRVESADAAKPSVTPDKQTIEQRVAAVRRHFHNQQSGDNVNGDKSDQISTGRLAQWYNWGNWPNWRNWPNWFNR
jgi:hypothetical protein